MTTVLSQKGQVVIPGVIREQLSLEPGDDFEVLTDNDDSIILRRITKRANAGLIDHLLACPFALDEIERSDEPPRSIDLG